MSYDKNQLTDYLNKTKFIALATVNESNEPVVRSLGSFGVDGFTTYFSTAKNSSKVKHIRDNPKVGILFQHEGQELPAFKNVYVSGNAAEVVEKEELDRVIGILSERSPRFKERVEKGLLGDNVFFKVVPGKLTYLDFSKGFGTDAVQIIMF